VFDNIHIFKFCWSKAFLYFMPLKINSIILELFLTCSGVSSTIHSLNKMGNPFKSIGCKKKAQ